MAHAALLSGMALANSGLGVAHGVAAALGVHARTRHGLACAIMLPAALATNRPHCEAELAELARGVWNEHWPSDTAAADAFVSRIDDLCRAVGVPRRLRDIDVTREQIPALVSSSHGNSLDGNPVSSHGRAIAHDSGAHVVIVTAGLSPAWQQILLFDTFSLDAVNRARQAQWCGSGKVLNVGIGLAHLAVPNVTISPLGGPARDAIEAEFRRVGASLRTIACHEPTRVCTTILDRDVRDHN